MSKISFFLCAVAVCAACVRAVENVHQKLSEKHPHGYRKKKRKKFSKKEEGFVENGIRRQEQTERNKQNRYKN